MVLPQVCQQEEGQEAQEEEAPGPLTPRAAPQRGLGATPPATALPGPLMPLEAGTGLLPAGARRPVVVRRRGQSREGRGLRTATPPLVPVTSVVNKRLQSSLSIFFILSRAFAGRQ